MKKLFVLPSLLIATLVSAQTTDDLLKDTTKLNADKTPVIIFNHGRVINANTTEMIGKGKMDFMVTHNFGDIAGSLGGIDEFFGLDNTTDVRIGFAVGLGKNFDLFVARAKGVAPVTELLETGFKWRFLQQTVDNSTPLSLALYVNNVISMRDTTNLPLAENNFKNFGDRTSQVFQLIIAKKIGKISLQLNPTFLTQGYVVPNDEKSLFALGGAIRFPISNRVNIIADYFHVFRSQESEDALGLKFYDPLSVGFEILTGGHVFHLNFTNATHILENRFIPRTTTNWGDGQYRWAFNLSRTFSLWRVKE